ncbi:hypothetical protein V8E55_005778 [Tylopilus felleus]
MSDTDTTRETSVDTNTTLGPSVDVDLAITSSSSVDTDADNIAVFRLCSVTQEWSNYSCTVNPAKPGPVTVVFQVSELPATLPANSDDSTTSTERSVTEFNSKFSSRTVVALPSIYLSPTPLSSMGKAISKGARVHILKDHEYNFLMKKTKRIEFPGFVPDESAGSNAAED